MKHFLMKITSKTPSSILTAINIPIPARAANGVAIVNTDVPAMLIPNT